MKNYLKVLNLRLLPGLFLFSLLFCFIGCEQSNKDNEKSTLELKFKGEHYKLGSLVFAKDNEKATLIANNEEIDRYLKAKKIKVTNAKLEQKGDYVYFFYDEIKKDGGVINTAEEIPYNKN